MDKKMHKKINILYEISNLGLGGYDLKARTGIFRVIENIIEKIQDFSSLEVQFTSCVSLNEAILTDYYLNNERKNWKPQSIELWNLMFGSIYLKILKNIHNNKSRTL